MSPTTWTQASVEAGIFDTANTLIGDAITTIKLAIGLGAFIYVMWVVFGRRGLAAIISAGFVAALAVWLVALDGVEQIAGLIGVTLG